MLAVQSAATLAAFGATAVTGRFVSLSMIRELGPVLTGIMVSGRNASSMASELGSMVVTEQIDAMRALGVDPMRKLVTPRLVATVTMLFFLTIISDFFGILGGAGVTIFMNGQNGTQYFSMAYESLHARDILQGLVKPLFSGSSLPPSAASTAFAPPAARRASDAQPFKPLSPLRCSSSLLTSSSAR